MEGEGAAVKRTPTAQTGETGELLVLAELYRRGVIGAQPGQGTRGIDVLTSTGPTIQVKARRAAGRWVLGREGQRPEADLVVLVTVGMRRGEDEFFVVPTGDLYEWAEARHRAYWATRPGEVTGERTLVQVRSDEFLEQYRDAWERVTKRL